VTAAPWATLILAALLLSACREKPAAEVLAQPPQDTLAQTLWTLPDFTLTERTGQAVTLADLKGKVWVADFFYSTCPGPCPMLSSRLSSLQDKLGADDRIRLVSISSDPEKDTPEILQQYAARFRATERWLFLTGPKQAIHDLAFTGFKLPIAETPAGAEPIIHSTRLVLVDQTGAVRAVYEGIGSDSTEQIVRDVRRLLESKP
jgi:protein SCO1/2